MPQARVGLGDPVELRALTAGEITGVLPQRVARFGDVLRVAGRASLAGEAETAGGATAFGLVPGAAPFDIERFDRPRDNMERIGAPHRVRGPVGDDAGDPVSHISRNMGEQRGSFGTELVEEHFQGGVVAARSGPHQPATVMVHDDDQVAVAAFVGDLVDPDPTQPVETIDGRVDVRVHARHDRPDRAPRDA